MLLDWVFPRNHKELMIHKQDVCLRTNAILFHRLDPSQRFLLKLIHRLHLLIISLFLALERASDNPISAKTTKLANHGQSHQTNCP